MGAVKIDVIRGRERERENEKGEYSESVIFLGVLTVWGQQQPSRAAAASQRINTDPAPILRPSLGPTYGGLEVFVESCFATWLQTADDSYLELPLFPLTSLLFLPLLLSPPPPPPPPLPLISLVPSPFFTSSLSTYLVPTVCSSTPDILREVASSSNDLLVFFIRLYVVLSDSPSLSDETQNWTVGTLLGVIRLAAPWQQQLLLLLL